MKRKIILGVTSSIAIYKSCSLARALVKRGAEVKTIMTEAATKFISPLLFENLTHNQAYVDLFALEDYDLRHISLAEWADVLIIAPCTANTLSKIALGLSDNLLTSVVLAFPPTKPIIIAPAMNNQMWENKIIQGHYQVLQKSACYKIIGPKEGILASGRKGWGVMADIEEIITAL